jgi:hypothetical protein
MSSRDTVIDPFFGFFVPEGNGSAVPTLVKKASAPTTLPDPNTGRPLRVATVDGRAKAICPSCSTSAKGGFLSFVGDLRLAYACPSCEQFVWLQGA